MTVIKGESDRAIKLLLGLRQRGRFRSGGGKVWAGASGRSVLRRL
jgi:hypothetical protein